MMKIIENGIRYTEIYMHRLQVLGFAEGCKRNNLVIPEKVQDMRVVDIAPNAFFNEQCLETVSLPESMEHIYQSAFRSCKNLKKVELTAVVHFKECVTLVISEKAFAHCLQLKEFLGNGRVATISSRAFECCHVLKNLDLKIQKVNESAFAFSPMLRELTFATFATLNEECFVDSYISKISFKGDALIPKNILGYIRRANMEICCMPDSNLAVLAYSGYHVEVVNN